MILLEYSITYYTYREIEISVQTIQPSEQNTLRNGSDFSPVYTKSVAIPLHLGTGQRLPVTGEFKLT